MPRNNEIKQTIKLVAQLKSDGFTEFASQLNAVVNAAQKMKIKDRKTSGIMEFLAEMKAFAQEIKELKSSGFAKDARELSEVMSAAMVRVTKKDNRPFWEKGLHPIEYPSGKIQDRLNDPNTRSIVNAASNQLEEFKLNTVKQINKENEKANDLLRRQHQYSAEQNDALRDRLNYTEESRKLRLKTLEDISKPETKNQKEILKYHQERKKIIESMLNEQTSLLRDTRDTQWEGDTRKKISDLQSLLSVEKSRIESAKQNIKISEEEAKIQKVINDLAIEKKRVVDVADLVEESSDQEKLEHKKQILAALNNEMIAQQKIAKITTDPERRKAALLEIDKYRERIRLTQQSIDSDEQKSRITKLQNQALIKEISLQKKSIELGKSNGNFFQRIGRQAKESIKHFFSLEKIMARISFVITAKFAYDIITFLKRMPSQIYNIFVEFESEMSKTFALISGNSDSIKKQLTKDIQDLSKQYGIVAKEISSAFYEIISAQVPLQYATKVLETAIELSIAGAADLRTATRALVQIANAYEISFTNIERVANVAFQSVKYGQLTLEQYTEEMSKVVSTASLFNVSIEEVSAAISTMTINGINANQAFTSLNQMLMKIATPTSEAIKLMKELGIQLSIRDVKEKGLGYVLDELMPIMDGATESGKQLLAILFKNRTGFKAIASLLENADEYNENYMMMLNSVNSMSEGLQERMKDVSFQANRLKTIWQDFLMSFISGKNKNIALRFIVMLQKAIKLVANNLDVIKSILIAVISMIASKAISSIGILIKNLSVIKKSLISLKTVILSLGTTAKTVWAEATLGLSLVITALMEAAFWIGKLIKDTKNNTIDKFFNVRDAKNNIETLSSELEILDDKINKLQSIEKLINRFNALNEVENKTERQSKNLSDIFNSIQENVQGFSQELINAVSNVNNMKDAIKILEKEAIRIREQQFIQNFAMLAYETSISGATLSKNKSGKRYDKQFGVRGMYNEFGNITEEYSNALEKSKENLTLEIDLIAQSYKNFRDTAMSLIESGDTKKMNMAIQEFSSNMNKQLREYMKLEPATKDGQENLALLIESVNNILGSLSNMQSMYASISAAKTDIADFNEETSKETSYMKELNSLLTDAIGNQVFTTLDAFKQAKLDAIEEIKKKMQEEKDAGTIITDEKEVLAGLKRYKQMLLDNANIEIFEAGMQAISAQLELGKALLDAGKTQEGMLAISEARKSFESFNVIDTFSDKQLTDIYKLSPQQAQDFKRNYQKFASEFLLSWFTSAQEFMSDQELFESVIETFNIDRQILNNISGLESLIKKAAAEGRNTEAAALDKLYNIAKEELLNNLKLIAGIPEDNEYINEIESNIKNAVDNGATKFMVERILTESIMNAENAGIIFTDEQREKLKKAVDELIEDNESEFNIKKLLGITEYENETDAIINVTEQMVSRLSEIWSFYWQWEQQQLQKQTEKKLEILNHEKDVMLANTNMSEEQRALITERYAERERKLQEEQAKKLASIKKRQAIFDATIDLAKGIISIWSANAVRPITAAILTSLLSGIWATQMAMINNTKYAKGGYTGHGYGKPDETGYKPAGIVHEGELVVDKKTLDKNFVPMMSLYQHLKSGGDMSGFISQYLLGNIPQASIKPDISGSFANGGYVGKNNNLNKIYINLSGARVIDNIELSKMVEVGNRKRRVIRV